MSIPITGNCTCCVSWTVLHIAPTAAYAVVKKRNPSAK